MDLKLVQKICENIYKKLGKGLSESAYQRALEHSLMKKNLSVIREYYLNVIYDGICISNIRPDLCITNWDCLIELKAVNKFSKKDILQAKQYKKISKKNVILINFGYNRLEIKLY